MTFDVGKLLARDHAALEQSLDVLHAPWRAVTDKQDALAELRVCFAAHAEGEGVVLRSLLPRVAAGEVRRVVTQILAAHEAQEALLAELHAVSLASPQWHEYVRQFRDLLRAHRLHEERITLGVLRSHLPETIYASLAGAYATERLRALMMLPSLAWRRSRGKTDSDGPRGGGAR
jgi:hypothetical protein